MSYRPPVSHPLDILTRYPSTSLSIHLRCWRIGGATHIIITIIPQKFLHFYEVLCMEWLTVITQFVTHVRVLRVCMGYWCEEGAVKGWHWREWFIGERLKWLLWCLKVIWLWRFGLLAMTGGRVGVIWPLGVLAIAAIW